MNKIMLNIVIPVFNRTELTQKTILNIYKCKNFNNKIPFVITVVDNGSNEKLRNILTQFADDGIIDNLYLLDKNMGVSCACNIGLRAVDSNFFLKIDNDITIIDHNFFEKLFKLYDCVEKFSILGPALLKSMIYESSKIIDTCYGKLALCTSNVPGGALLIPSIVYNILGGFNEEYGLYGADDGDYGARMKAAGFNQYYYEYENFFIHEGKWDNSEYNGYNLDKAKEHKRLFVTDDGKIGLFRLNLFLYELCIRSWKVPYRYIITKKDRYHVEAKEKPEYQKIKQAICRSQTIVQSYYKKSNFKSYYMPDYAIQKLKKIWKECGQECTYENIISS
ncbi:MAG: glycosyltransferase [Lachnospiraceae bacterium]|nr:glycosyltransferase [Lachnospiraceae bacterium]